MSVAIEPAALAVSTFRPHVRASGSRCGGSKLFANGISGTCLKNTSQICRLQLRNRLNGCARVCYHADGPLAPLLDSTGARRWMPLCKLNFRSPPWFARVAGAVLLAAGRLSRPEARLGRRSRWRAVVRPVSGARRRGVCRLAAVQQQAGRPRITASMPTGPTSRVAMA